MPPDASAGKEFQNLESARRKRHRLRDGGATGQHRHGRIRKRRGKVGRRAGTDEELRARGDRAVDVGRARHGADADDAIRHIGGDRLDRLDRRRRAQRHLDHRQAARRERARERHRIGGALDGQDRNDGGLETSAVGSSMRPVLFRRLCGRKPRGAALRPAAHAKRLAPATQRTTSPVTAIIVQATGSPSSSPRAPGRRRAGAIGAGRPPRCRRVRAPGTRRRSRPAC